MAENDIVTPNVDLNGALEGKMKTVRRKETEDRLKGLLDPAQATPPPPPSIDQGGAPEDQLSTLEETWNKTRETERAVISDLFRGTFESPAQLVGGVRDAVQETFNALDGMSQWLNEIPGSPEWFAEQLGSSTREETLGEESREILPEVPEAATVTGGVVRSLAQFATGFIPALRAVKAVSAGGKALTGLKGIAQTEAAAALGSALVFDPHEERLSNLMTEWDNPAFNNAVTKYLSAKPEDSGAEGRFKNAVEGLGLGLVAEGVFRGVRAIRANRIEKGVKGAKLGGEDESIIGDRLGTGKAIEIGKVKPGAGSTEAPEGVRRPRLPFQMNWSKYTSSEQIEGAVTAVARLYSKEIDEARRGTISTTELQGLADDLGLTAEDLLSGRFQGGGYKAEEILAMRDILEASTEDLIRLGRQAANSTDDADVFAFRKMMDTHLALQAQFQGGASEAGRLLRALQMPSGSKEKQVSELGQMMLKGGESMNKIRELAGRVGEINDPAVMNQMLRRSLGKRASDALHEWWYFSLLSGPKTHLVNITSTGANLLWQVPERFLASGFRTLRGGTEGVQAAETAELLQGYLDSIPGALRQAGKAFMEGRTSDMWNKLDDGLRHDAITSKNFPVGKYVENMMGKISPSAGRVLAKGINAGIDGFGTLVRVPGRALVSEDEFFKTLGFNAQMRALAARKAGEQGLRGDEAGRFIANFISNPPAGAMDEAKNFALETTFTQPLGPTGRHLQSALNRIPGARLVVPFTTTPTNLLKWSAVRSPVGALSKSFWQDIQAGGARSDLALAKITMGSTIAMSAVDFALKGMITGAGPMDPDLRRTWERTHQSFSIRVGDSWYAYERGDPFGMLLGAAASYAEVANGVSDPERERLAAAIAFATANSVTNKTWMTGMVGFAETMANPESFQAESYLRRLAAGFTVPSVVNQVTQAMDPVWRDVESVGDALRARVPGYSEELPANRNLWGQKYISNTLGSEMISPIYKMDIPDEPIDDWLFENKVLPKKARPLIMGAELTPQQYDRYQELAGNGMKDPMTGMGLYDTLNAMIKGTHPRAMLWAMSTDGPQGGRATIVDNYIQSYRQMAQQQMLVEFPELRNRVEAVAREGAAAKQITIMDPSAGEAPEQ